MMNGSGKEDAGLQENAKPEPTAALGGAWRADTVPHRIVSVQNAPHADGEVGAEPAQDRRWKRWRECKGSAPITFWAMFLGYRSPSFYHPLFRQIIFSDVTHVTTLSSQRA